MYVFLNLIVVKAPVFLGTIIIILRGLPLITYAPRGGGGGSKPPMHFHSTNAYVINGRPLIIIISMYSIIILYFIRKNSVTKTPMSMCTVVFI